MTSGNRIAAQVRLYNGNIVDVPNLSPEHLLVAMEFSPPETEVEVIHDNKIRLAQLSQISMVCVCPHSIHFNFISLQTISAVGHMKKSTCANRQLRTKRAQNSLYSILSPPPPNCLPHPLKL